APRVAGRVVRTAAGEVRADRRPGTTVVRRAVQDVTRVVHDVRVARVEQDRRLPVAPVRGRLARPDGLPRRATGVLRPVAGAVLAAAEDDVRVLRVDDHLE